MQGAACVSCIGCSLPKIGEVVSTLPHFGEADPRPNRLGEGDLPHLLLDGAYVGEEEGASLLHPPPRRLLRRSGEDHLPEVVQRVGDPVRRKLLLPAPQHPVADRVAQPVRLATQAKLPHLPCEKVPSGEEIGRREKKIVVEGKEKNADSPSSFRVEEEELRPPGSSELLPRLQEGEGEEVPRSLRHRPHPFQGRDLLRVHFIFATSIPIANARTTVIHCLHIPSKLESSVRGGGSAAGGGSFACFADTTAAEGGGGGAEGRDTSSPLHVGTLPFCIASLFLCERQVSRIATKAE